MIAGEGTAVVPVSPDEALGFVLDLERYRQADRKIGPVRWVRPDENGALVRFRSRMAGLPGPVVTQRVDRHGNRLDVRSVEPAWMNRLVTFEGAGHVLEAERADEVASLLREHFRAALAPGHQWPAQQ